MLGKGDSSMDRQARQLAIQLAVVGLAAVVYLAASWGAGGFGFPLDDAWIHQTYARNLIAHGEWSFIPGEASAGSTAPLWTALLAAGYVIGLNPLIWTYLAGIILLVYTAWVCGGWFSFRNPGKATWTPFVAALVGLEWHLLWASVSGMETIASALVIAVVFSQLDGHRGRWVGLGALIGLGIWIRPDAITLLLPAGLLILMGERESPRGKLRTVAQLLVGTALVLGPYLYFNFHQAGEIWPSTFYAKQQEYGVLQKLPLSERLASQFGLPFIGPALLLLPGIIIFVVHHVRQRRWGRLLPLVWAVVYLGMYAWRLPVAYQHGRYAMPTIPVLLVVGLEGLSLWARPGDPVTWRRLLSRAWIGAVGGLAMGFVVLGAQAYRRDVAIIETEMVASARWIQGNTAPDAVIAAHDIGAIGYYSERKLIDLAGLVSPEVIPIMRDEAALRRYLDEHGADYLVTFPAWYPELSAHGHAVFRTGGAESPAAGGENMVIYSWPGCVPAWGAGALRPSLGAVP